MNLLDMNHFLKHAHHILQSSHVQGMCLEGDPFCILLPRGFDLQYQPDITIVSVSVPMVNKFLPHQVLILKVSE
jgi:hypothetical protein